MTSLRAADGGVFFLGRNSVGGNARAHTVYRFDSTGSLLDTNATGVALGVAEGTVWFASDMHNVYHWQEASGGWSPAVAGAVSSDGSVFFLGKNAVGGNARAHTVYRFDSTGSLLDTNATGVGLGAAEGTVWFVSDMHNVYHWQASDWSPAVAGVIDPRDGSVFFLGRNAVGGNSSAHTVWRFSSTGSLLDTNATAVRLVVAEGAVWFVSDMHNVYHWQAASGGWSPAMAGAANPQDGSVFFLRRSAGGTAHPVWRLAGHFAAHREGYAQARLRLTQVGREDLAFELLAQVRDEGRDFADLAHEHSLHPSRDDGGRLGLLRRGEVPPAVAEAVFTAREGDVVGPLATPQGFQLLLVEKLLPADLDAHLTAVIRRQLFDCWLNEQLAVEVLRFPLLEVLR